MAATKKSKTEEIDFQTDGKSDFTEDLINSLNKEFGTKIAYNLAHGDSPTAIKRWVSTGCRQLDYIVSNKRHGGLPEGRIIEISGPPSTGKSHIALQVARTTQQMGGIVVYIDTENATNISKLGEMGIDISKRFVFIETSCIEDVFSVMESTILKAKHAAKDVPITVIWDSVAATSPKQELMGEYEDNSIGLAARVISKGMRKITGLIGNMNVTLLCLNQQRMKVGITYGSPIVTPGGQAIPFHSSIRIELSGGSKIEKDDRVIGIHVAAKTIKNKVAPPHRRAEFDIIFGRGIMEHEQLFDLMREAGPQTLTDGTVVSVEGTSAWKLLKIVDKSGAHKTEKTEGLKFYKSDFGKLFADPTLGPYLESSLEKVMVIDTNAVLESTHEEEE